MTGVECKVCGVVYTDNKKMHNRSFTCNACLAKGLKWCNNCHTVKYLVDFHVRTEYDKGAQVTSHCAQCRIEKTLNRRRVNANKDNKSN
jgi:hypothetical protein